jgi:hypothetical protein
MDDKKLEDSLRGLVNNEKPKPSQPQMSPTEEIGFHKGALNTLIAERNELIKMAGTVESIMQAHINALKQLGVELKSN